jgi:putative transcriptional regulator
VNNTPQHDARPDRHFGEELLFLLFERGAGTVGAGAGLAVACHLALCPACASLAAELERSSAALTTPEAPRPELRDRILAGMDRAGPAAAPQPRQPSPALLVGLPPLPEALRRAIAAVPGAPARWRWLLPGVRCITLWDGDQYAARLFRLRPGVVIPHHDHHGPEQTVVFAGGLDDHSGHLGRGDALTMLPGERHQQSAAPGEECIALIVNDLPPRPLTLKGRLLKRIAGL